jgi:DoxX-like family
MKLVLPLEVLTEQMPLPGLFVRFIGVAEVLGAIGLIFPGLLRMRPGLSPRAAAGLVIIPDARTVITESKPSRMCSGSSQRMWVHSSRIWIWAGPYSHGMWGHHHVW